MALPGLNFPVWQRLVQRGAATAVIVGVAGAVDLRGGTILDYSSFLTEMSNWTCVGHFIENWTSSLRIYKHCRVAGGGFTLRLPQIPA